MKDKVEGIEYNISIVHDKYYFDTNKDFIFFSSIVFSFISLFSSLLFLSKTQKAASKKSKIKAPKTTKQQKHHYYHPNTNALDIN